MFLWHKLSWARSLSVKFRKYYLQQKWFLPVDLFVNISKGVCFASQNHICQQKCFVLVIVNNLYSIPKVHDTLQNTVSLLRYYKMLLILFFRYVHTEDALFVNWLTKGVNTIEIAASLKSP